MNEYVFHHFNIICAYELLNVIRFTLNIVAMVEHKEIFILQRRLMAYLQMKYRFRQYRNLLHFLSKNRPLTSSGKAEIEPRIPSTLALSVNSCFTLAFFWCGI